MLLGIIQERDGGGAHTRELGQTIKQGLREVDGGIIPKWSSCWERVYFLSATSPVLTSLVREEPQ
jgi:hypothetical protein